MPSHERGEADQPPPTQAGLFWPLPLRGWSCAPLVTDALVVEVTDNHVLMMMVVTMLVGGCVRVVCVCVYVCVCVIESVCVHVCQRACVLSCVSSFVGLS